VTVARCRCGHERAAHEWEWCEGVCFPPGFPEASCDCDAYVPARDVLLVVGGTPAALALRDRLDDPEFRAELEASVRRFAEQLGQAIRPAIEQVLQQARALGEWVEQNRQVLVDAGALPAVPPEDPRARALWLRRHRGTGPDRQLQHRRPPRRLG
jgi:hypothetical protein